MDEIQKNAVVDKLSTQPDRVCRLVLFFLTGYKRHDTDFFIGIEAAMEHLVPPEVSNGKAKD